MKKLLGLFFVIGILFLFSNCKKEYDCTCTSLTSLETYDKTGKGKDATEACNDAADKVLTIPVESCVPK